MNAWMNSAGHKANILKKAYREVGIGIRSASRPTRASARPSRPTSASSSSQS